MICLDSQAHQGKQCYYAVTTHVPELCRNDLCPWLRNSCKMCVVNTACGMSIVVVLDNQVVEAAATSRHLIAMVLPILIQ